MRYKHEALVGCKRQLLLVRGPEHVFTARGANGKSVAANDPSDSDVNVFVEIQLGKKSIRLHSDRSS
jgi:hypothetical protein